MLFAGERCFFSPQASTRKPTDICVGLQYVMAHDLGAWLERVYGDPTLRPDFFRVLLRSNIFIVGSTGEGKSGKATLAVGDEVSVVSGQKPSGEVFIPFFTSKERLRKWITTDSSCLELAAKDLFQLVNGAGLILDPGAECAMEFSPEDVRQMLTLGLPSYSETEVVQQSTEVTLAEPASPPLELMQALNKFLRTRPQVQVAYLCWMSRPGFEASFLIGIQGSGEMTHVLKEVGAVIDGVRPERPIDLMEIRRGDSGVSSYLENHGLTIYKRGLFNRIRSSFRRYRPPNVSGPE